MSTLEIVTLATAILGAVCGVLGAVLGIINTHHQISTTLVKLRIAPKVAKAFRGDTMLTIDRPSSRTAEFMGDPATCCLCIEISNLSAFPVTISEVGFGNPNDSERRVMLKPRLSSEKEIPVRLESRESVTAYGQTGDLALDQGPRAYVVTDCGNVALGSTPITEALSRKANRAQQETA